MWQVKEEHRGEYGSVHYWIPLLPTDVVVPSSNPWNEHGDVVLAVEQTESRCTLIAPNGEKRVRVHSHERKHVAMVCENPHEEMEGLGLYFTVLSSHSVEILANYLAPDREPNFWLRYGKYLEEVPCSN